jgi:predicted ester cyclase
MTPKEITKAWFAGIDGHNFEKLDKMMDDKHIMFNPMTPEPMNKQGHLDMIKMMTSSFGEHKHNLDVVIGEGEWTAVRGRLTAKHTGEFNGVSPTGRKVEFSWMSIMHIVNEKIVEEYFEFSPAAIMQQIS